MKVLSAIVARPTTSCIEFWTKMNYHKLYIDHPDWRYVFSLFPHSSLSLPSIPFTFSDFLSCRTSVADHLSDIVAAVWPPVFISFFHDNPSVLGVVHEHIQACWRNYRSNEKYVSLSFSFSFSFNPFLSCRRTYVRVSKTQKQGGAVEEGKEPPAKACRTGLAPLDVLGDDGPVVLPPPAPVPNPAPAPAAYPGLM